MRAVIAGAIAALALSVAGSSAADESTRGTVYVQGSAPLGMNYWNFPSNGYGWTAWRPDIEIGVHLSRRHEGVVLGVRQAFLVNAIQGAAAGTTMLRAGYDIPFAIGSFELGIAPYGTVGIGYVFDGAPPGYGGPSAGLAMSWGIDAKLFLAGGFYTFARPFEMGFQCLHDSGSCALSLVFGAGVGIAFPSPN